MRIPSIVTQSSLKLISGLANNEDSLASMVVKDWMGDGATVYTYKKEGGKDDAREKAIEEFGTGAVWLFGIPFLKKVIDKTVYPIFKLNPEFDARLLDNKEKLSQIKNVLKENAQDTFKEQKEIFKTLEDKNPVLKKFTNSQMYKGLAIGKFAIATAVSAVALSMIIKYKQKTTNERIKKEVKNNQINFSKTLVTNSVKQNKIYETFTSKEKNNASVPSFKGGLSEIMYNPIKNTMLLDGVITTTRLKEARKGERKEVAFKELFQIVFIYGLAKPIQKIFEFVGKKANAPIELDPKVLFTKGLPDKIKNSKGSMDKVLKSENMIETLSKMDVKNPLIELLDKDGAIATLKGKNSEIKGINYLNPIDENKVKETIKNINSLNSKISNLKGIKAFKVFAVLANVFIAAYIMGVLQPKLNILMRKVMNNGDNRNPAIIEQEKQMENSLNTYQG